MKETIPKSVRKKYVPPSLSSSDKQKQIKSILSGTKRPILKSYKSRESKWTKMAKEYFGEGNTSKRDIARILSKGDKVREKEIYKGLDQIMKKGEKAYYTSGSRPNQTPESWGYARVFSVLFGGKSRKIDNHIVEQFKIPLLYIQGGMADEEGYKTPEPKEELDEPPALERLPPKRHTKRPRQSDTDSESEEGEPKQMRGRGCCSRTPKVEVGRSFVRSLLGSAVNSTW